MGRRRLTVRQVVGYAGLALLAVLVAAAAIWRGDILRAGLDPQIPFQTYDPPPAPAYGDPRAWVLRDARVAGAGAAAVFFVHSTTYDGGSQWNGPIDDREAGAYLRRVALPNYAGPFARSGGVSAPRYRQASLYTRLTLRDDAREARAFAYRDISSAYDAWLARHREGPLILVGVEQGAELLDRLVRERVATDPDVTERLVAIYLIDALVAVDRLPAPACTVRTDIGCVVGWAQVREDDDGEVARRRRRALVWDDAGHLVDLDDRPTLCVNPVSGMSDGVAVEARRHLGAANATGLEWGLRPAFLDRIVMTQCRDGFLRHSQPGSESFEEGWSWSDRRKVKPYNLFYADIEADVQARLAHWRSLNPPPADPRASRTAPPASGSPAPSA